MSRWLLLVFLTAVAACGPLRRMSFTPPEVAVYEVAVTGLGLTGGLLDVSMRISNPNSYALRTTAGSLDLMLEQSPFGTLEIVRPIVVPARGDTTVTVPMTFLWSGVGAGARALLGRGSVTYRLTGRLRADTPVGLREIDVSTGGTVRLTDLIR
ncbi:MAG: LEA type 2 family protein [Gemmatimonadales bacterium]